MCDVRGYDTKFRDFFKQDEQSDLAYCPEVNALMEYFNVPYNSNDWILFIDSSTASMHCYLFLLTILIAIDIIDRFEGSFTAQEKEAAIGSNCVLGTNEGNP